jgi:hypothetical protein
MKFCKLTLALGLLAAFCLPATAQVQNLHVNVPFNFVVGNQMLPAGQYQVTQALNADHLAWLITGENITATVLTDSVESPKIAHVPSLVFLASGGRYSLLQIWNGEHFGRQVPRPNVKQMLVAQGSNLVEIAAE